MKSGSSSTEILLHQGANSHKIGNTASGSTLFLRQQRGLKLTMSRRHNHLASLFSFIPHLFLLHFCFFDPIWLWNCSCYNVQKKNCNFFCHPEDEGSCLSAGLTYCILRVEDVGGRWVVYDDDFTELPAQSAEVFDVVSSVENTGFPEEPGAKYPPLVQQVCHRVSILIEEKPTKTTRLAETETRNVTVLQEVTQTLARLAVKRTHSKSSPIFWRNSSTWGLFSTYTWDKDAKTNAVV